MEQFIEFAFNHWDLFLLLVVILALLAGQSWLGRLRGYAEIEPQQAVQTMNHDDAVLLDVREDGEVEKGRVAGAVHIPLSKLGARKDELEKHRQSPIIVACRSGNRSAKAAAMLRKEGYEPIYNLKGGMLAWQNAGLPVTAHRHGKRK